VKFTTGGTPAPGVWYRRGDPEPVVDEKVRRLFAEPDVTDVMVAGDFVTVGIAATSSWERRLEPLLALVTELYAASEPSVAAGRTREELLQEAGGLRPRHRPEELHLLDPDDETDRATLDAAFDDEQPRVRRIAVAVLAESGDAIVRRRAVWRGFEDTSRTVRRTAVDAAAAIAADAEAADPELRPLFTAALASDDAWIRWKAVRALGDLDPGPTRDDLELVLDDPDFQVRFEVEKVLREQRSAP
jgi:HEAT repeat protein